MSAMGDLQRGYGADPLAKAEQRPAPVAVYLQAKPAMAPNLKVVLRLLGDRATVLEFPWQALRFEHVSAIRALLVEKLAPAYARKCLTAVRGVLRTAWKMRVISREEYEQAIDVDPISGDSPQAGRMLSTDEIWRMFESADVRDRAIIALAVYAGLRREEISALDRSSIQGFKVVVVGKGRKHREVFLPAAAIVRVSEWLSSRGPLAEDGPLFVAERKGGRYRTTRLSPSGVWKVIRRVAVAAEVPSVTPHDFRRTYASMLFDAGVDPVTVQALMGHADLNTTSRYDRRGDDRKKRAAEALAGAFKRDGD